MGWLIPKTLLKWREPKVVRRTRAEIEEKKVSPLTRPLLVIFYFSMLMLVWYLATRNPQNNPPPAWVAVPLAVGCAIVFAYLLPLLVRLAPSEVKVTEKGIFRVIGNQATWWVYRDVVRLEIASREMEGERISVLAVTTMEGATSIVGIDSSVSLDELRRVLSEKAFHFDRDGTRAERNFSGGNGMKGNWASAAGLILALIGALLLMGSAVYGFGGSRAKKDAEEVKAELDERYKELIDLEEDPSAGLRRVLRWSVAQDKAHTHFLGVSFLVLASVNAILLGLLAMLWGKLKRTQAGLWKRIGEIQQAVRSPEPQGDATAER